MSAITTPVSALDRGMPGPDSKFGGLIKAHSNSFGRDAAQMFPELAEVLRTDPALCLDYDDSGRDDGRAQKLRELLAEREAIAAERILLGGSGLERIPMIASAFSIQTIIRIEGDFPGFERPCLLNGIARKVVPIDSVTRTLSPETLADSVRHVAKAMLCLTMGATNPGQTPITRAHVIAAAQANPDLLIIVDGAYRQFTNDFHLAPLADEHPQVIYLQVASKDLFLPGARLSWVVASERHVGRLKEIQAPYPLNSVGVEQATALLQRQDILDAMRWAQAAARDRLAYGMGCLGLPRIVGVGPWVLVKWPVDASSVVRALERRFGILVQQQILAPFGPSWFRISATSPQDAEMIQWAMAILVAELFAGS